MNFKKGFETRYVGFEKITNKSKIFYRLKDYVDKFDNMHVDFEEMPNKSNIFYKLKSYIDYQTSKLKVYIPPEFGSEFNTDFEKPFNSTNCNFPDRSNFGHGALYALDDLTGQFDTDQFSTDIIFYRRITQNIDLLVGNIEKANVVYIPFLAGSSDGTRRLLKSLAVYEHHRILHSRVQLWIYQNREILKNKTLLLLNSRIGRE